MAINSYKICPECGHKNSLEFIECEKCEADLASVKVTLVDDSKVVVETKVLEEAEKIMLGDRVKKLDEVDFGLSRVKQHL